MPSGWYGLPHLGKSTVKITLGLCGQCSLLFSISEQTAEIGINGLVESFHAAKQIALYCCQKFTRSQRPLQCGLADQLKGIICADQRIVKFFKFCICVIIGPHKIPQSINGKGHPLQCFQCPVFKIFGDVFFLASAGLNAGDFRAVLAGVNGGSQRECHALHITDKRCHQTLHVCSSLDVFVIDVL